MIKFVIMYVGGQLFTEKKTAELVEVYAALYDIAFHKKGDLWFISENQKRYRQVQTYIHENTRCYTNLGIYWSDLYKKIDSTTVFFVWDSTEKTIFSYADNKMRNYQIYPQIVSVKQLYKAAVKAATDSEVRIRDCMEEMGLTFHSQDTIDPFYRTDCLHRILIKMYRHRIDKESDQFVKSLRKKKMERIASKMDLSFAISYREKKQIEGVYHYLKSDKAIKKLARKKIIVETDLFAGKLFLKGSGVMFQYHTKKYYKGEREHYRSFPKEWSQEQIAGHAISLIRDIESPLRHGVGSTAVSELLERLCS